MARPVKPQSRKPSPRSLPAAEILKSLPPAPAPERLQEMIRTAAYFRAEKEAFRGDPAVYWADAEKEILARFHQP